MRYELTETTITIFIDNPKKDAPRKTVLLYSNTKLTRAYVDVICNSLIRRGQGTSLATQRCYLYGFLRPLLKYFAFSQSLQPTNSNEWQVFLLQFYHFQLSSKESGPASAKSRLFSWISVVKVVFEFWVADGIIPCDVVVPSFKLKKIKSLAINQYTIGKSEIQPIPVMSAPQKLLANVNFSKDEANFLEDIERECRGKINAIKDVCLSHWDNLIKDMQTGIYIAKKLSPRDIDQVIQSGQYRQLIKRCKPHYLGSPSHPEGYIWAVALCRLWLHSGKDRNCVAINTLKASEFFNSSIGDGIKYQSLSLLTSMPGDAFKQLTFCAQLYRFVGILSNIDIAAACCLLTIEHPEFTSEALQSAKLYDANGKSYLQLTDKPESSILSLDKPRAGERKSVVLTPLSYKLIKDIIEVTTPIRKILRVSGDKTWKYLFLGYGRGGRLAQIDGLTVCLTATTKTLSLVRLYPTLSDNGLTLGTLDYRRIRTTMGVLKWFETGSIKEMSKRLGNSKRVVLEHYLPSALLHAWNTRIIRRFQNTLIVLASHDEEFLLDVTDFSSIADLQHFIAQIILEYPGNSSPVAAEVKSRLCTTDTTTNIHYTDVLNIRLSAKSLGYLYAFSDLAVKTLNPDKLCCVDTQSQLAPIRFVELARMIRHACENEQTKTYLSELLDLPKLRLMNQHAIAYQASIASHIHNLSIKQQWGVNE